jgi:hypothetical protein
MSWYPSDKEIKTVSAISPERRYEHFIKKVADNQEVWSLKNADGWVLASQDDIEVIPVWPHARYAEVSAEDAWANTEAAVITLDEWLDKWLPGIRRDGRLLAVFPTPTSKGFIVPSEAMKEDLEAEIEEYY